MRDVTLPLRTAYYNLLNDMLVDGRKIKVYDLQAPKTAETPYIIIGEMFSVSRNTKDTFGTEVTVDLLIHNNFDGDFGGRRQTDIIADGVLQLVIPTPGHSGVHSDYINIFQARHLGSIDELDNADTGRKYTKRITIEHLIEEIKTT